MKQWSEPIATQYVRELTGTTVRDDDVNKVILPPYLTKRGMYDKFCFERGWKVSTNAKGTVTLAPREDDDWLNEGEEAAPICSRRQFDRFWKQHYPEMVIRKPTKDICDECYSFYNCQKYKAAKKKSVDSNGHL